MTVSNGVKTAEHIFYLDVKGTIQWVREDITGSKTWATGNIYIIDERDIAVKGTLAIQPGAIVKLASGRSLFTQDSGCIVAVGTEENPIIFTSWRDDIHGGDTNGDGGYTSPTREIGAQCTWKRKTQTGSSGVSSTSAAPDGWHHARLRCV